MSTLPTDKPKKDRDMITVKICFSRENMHTLEAIIGMYCDSEDPAIRRIADRACVKINAALNSLTP